MFPKKVDDVGMVVWRLVPTDMVAMVREKLGGQ